jgi:hypothetical protein
MADTQAMVAEARGDAPLVIGGQRIRVAPDRGHGQVRRQRGDGRRDPGERGRDGDGGGAAVDLDRTKQEGDPQPPGPDEFFLLANTAGCYTAEDAIRYARLARAAGFNELVKLEVIGDEATLLPDVQATLEAAKDARRRGLQGDGLHERRPHHRAPARGRGLRRGHAAREPHRERAGVVNPYFIREIKRRLEVPVIVDAGVGTASDACVTMEQGVDGVLMNTAWPWPTIRCAWRTR